MRMHQCFSEPISPYIWFPARFPSPPKLVEE